jgi:hypothetical protein
MTSNKARLALKNTYMRLTLPMDRPYRALSDKYDLPDDYERIYCFHIRKTGGTSLHSSFLSLGNEDQMEIRRRMSVERWQRAISGNYAFVAHRLETIERGNYFYGWSHWAKAKVTLPPRTFTITVLRDPYKRVLSYYDYLIEGDSKAYGFAVGGAERKWAEGGFSSFLDVVPKGHLLRQLQMFSQTFDPSEAADQAASCSFTFFTENFGVGLESLGKRLNLPLEMHHERKARDRYAPTDSEKDRLLAMLEPEYDMLSRIPESPVSRGGDQAQTS